MTALRRTAGLVLATLMACGMCWAQSDEPSLADIARQQPRQKAAKVFDDDNFQRTVPPPAPPANDVKPAAKADDKPAPASDPADVKALEKQLEDLKKLRDKTVTQVSGIQARLDSGALDGDLRSSLVDAQEAFKKRIAELEGQIGALEKKLAGAPADSQKGGGASSAGDKDSKPAADGSKSGAKPGASD